jgi:hypothetical protein
MTRVNQTAQPIPECGASGRLIIGCTGGCDPDHVLRVQRCH